MSGRAAGKQHLAAALAARTGAFVTVRGPMGSGKSALLRALAEQPGAVVLRASGDPAERDRDFGVADQLRPVPDGFVVLVVDDLQWADPSSVRWLIELAARALVVTAVREGEPGAGALPGSVVRLPPLPSVSWSPRRVAECLRRQPESVRAVAEAIAVLGRHAEAGLITALTGLDDGTCGAAVRTLRALGFVTAQGNPQFVAQAVADAVPATASGHRAAAVLLHDRGHPVTHVADHLVASRAPLDEWAVEVLRDAARQHRPNAVTYLRRAVPGPGRAATLIDLALAESATDPLLALHHLCYATELLAPGRERAEAVLRMPITALGTALPLVRDLLDDVGRDLRDPDLVRRLEARARYAGLTDPAELTDATARMRELGPDRAANRELLAVLAFATTLQGRTPAHEIAPLAEHLLAHAPTDEMTRLLVKTLCAADSPPAAATGTDRALVAVHLGDLADARRAAELVLDGPTGQDALLDLALVALKVGDEHLCERVLASLPSEVDNPGAAAVFDLLRGADAAAKGDTRAGLRQLTDAGRHLDRLGWRNVVLFPWRMAAAHLHQQLGDVTAARVLAEENHDLAVEWGAPAGIGRALRVLGSLTDGAEGLNLLLSAMDALSQSANRVELARTHLALGVRLRNRSEQVSHLQACQDIAAACGDQRLARQAATHLRGEVRRAELTRTERKVVALAAQGRSNQEIAEALSVGTRAVEKHLTNSYRKLGVVSRADLAGAFNHPF
ncbi:LuxR C-terminal-related transcriptional regulator [Lentzea sp. NPDC058450]|uniref:LuxR C-terminal-related transcriptional regulator n=1 Tax=Lentzea sp. NPDC058450 TaxID=3346505 RepID=UPI00365FCA8E